MGHDVEVSGETDSAAGDGSETTDLANNLSDDAIEEIAFLTRSPVRVRVLRTLHRRGTAERRELRELIDGVRTTVTRNLGALADRGWIEETDDGYAVTSCGEVVADELIELAESMALAVDLRPALRWLDVDRLDIGLEEFERAEITTAESMNPYAPVEEQIDLVRRSAVVRTALPTVNKQILRACRQTAENSEADVELVIEGEAVERFRSEPRYVDLFESVRRECTVLRHDDTIPYYLGVGDGTVQLGATDSDRVTKVLLRFADEPEVRSWAANRIDRFEREAKPVE